MVTKIYITLKQITNFTEKWRKRRKERQSQKNDYKSKYKKVVGVLVFPPSHLPCYPVVTTQLWVAFVVGTKNMKVKNVNNSCIGGNLCFLFCLHKCPLSFVHMCTHTAAPHSTVSYGCGPRTNFSVDHKTKYTLNWVWVRR